MKPILSQACFCCTLETGSTIIGYLYIIFGGFGIIGGIAGAVLVAESTDPAYEELKSTLMATFIVLVCICLLNVAAGVLLVLGIRQRNHNKMMFMMVMMVLNIIGGFMNFAGSATVGDVIGVLLGVALSIYFFLIVFSLYNKIKDESRNFGQPQYPYPQSQPHV